MVRQVLDAVYTRGPRKGQHKVKVVSRRKGWRAVPSGKLAVGSRAVGVGLDSEQARALDIAEWLAPSTEFSGERLPNTTLARTRAAIMASMNQDTDLVSRIRGVCKRAAVRQAYKLLDYRGVRPSLTSVLEAESDALLGLLSAVRRLDKLTGEQWQSLRVRRVLGMYAGRAAFRSLAAWATAGFKVGDNTFRKGDTRQFLGERLASYTLDLATESKLLASSLDHAAFDVQGYEQPSKANGTLPGCVTAKDLSEGLTVATKSDSPLDRYERVARLAFVRWVWQVGYGQFKRQLSGTGAGVAAQLRAAKSRCRVLGNVIMGQPLLESCGMAGFNTVKAFGESCDSAQLDKALKASRAAAIRDSASVECARVAQRRYALQAAQVIRQLRALNVAQWDCERLGVYGAGVSGSASGLVAVRRLMDKRAHYLALAKHYKRVALKAERDSLAQFDGMLDALFSDKFGNLRRVFGMVDKLGRDRGASRLNAGFIRQPSGKVAKVAKVASVSLPIGRAGRARPCAPLAS